MLFTTDITSAINQKTSQFEIWVWFIGQVNTMPAPYGKCSKASPSMSTCRLECKANYVNQICGCVEPYMRYATNGKHIVGAHETRKFK